jgi:MFS family permease
MIEKLLPTPTEFSLSQATILRNNIKNHIWDGSLYVFGMSFFAYQTIYPIFFKELGANSIVIGAIPVLWVIGANVPMAFIVHFSKQRKSFRSPMVFYGFFHRFLLFVSGLTAFFLIGKLGRAIEIPVFLFLMLLTAVVGSMSGLPWFQVYTKTVPVKLRGRLMGIRQLIGALLGVVGGYFVSQILASVLFPYNFATLFFLACFFTMISFVFLSKVHEPISKEIIEKEFRKIHIVHEAKNILTKNKNFRNYLVVDALLLMSLTATAFFAVHAVEKFQLPLSYAGTFTAIVMIGNIFGNIVFGIIADLYGHRVNLIALALSSLLASLFAAFSSNILVYGFVFFFLAFTITIQGISRLPFVAELCSESERPTYVGIINTITAPTVFVGILFGALVPSLGYERIFFIALMLALSAFIVLFKFVKDPRTAK